VGDFTGCLHKDLPPGLIRLQAIAYLPVTEEKKLAGAISYRRIMRSFLSMARQTGDQLEQPTRREAGQSPDR
jgi:predicted transcriptional regulator